MSIVLLLFVSVVSVFASDTPVRIQIRPASDSIQQIRYQRGTLPTGAWKSIPLSGETLVLHGFAGETEYLFVQQAEAEEDWGELYAYRYDTEKKSWSITSFPPKKDLRFSIRASEGTEQNIRYQHGAVPTETWRLGDSSSMPIEGFDSREEFLFVQQELGGDAWSDTYRYQYDYINERWSLLPPLPEVKEPKYATSLDLKAYALGPLGHSGDFYKYVLGGGVQMNAPLGKVLGHAGLTFSKGPSKSAWVKTQQSLGMTLGMADSLRLSEKMELIPELGFGAILHLLEADFDKDGTYQLELFVDMQVRLSLYLMYGLNERYKLFLAPVGVFFFEKHDVGFMYGCQAGLRISL